MSRKPTGPGRGGDAVEIVSMAMVFQSTTASPCASADQPRARAAPNRQVSKRLLLIFRPDDLRPKRCRRIAVCSDWGIALVFRRGDAAQLNGLPSFGGFGQACGQIHRIVAREHKIERPKARVLDPENGMGRVVYDNVRQNPARRQDKLGDWGICHAARLTKNHL